MIRTGTFSLEDFMKNTNLMAKHPEIFNTDRKDIAKKMIKKFEAYTKELNKLKNVDKFIDKLKKEYNAHNQEAQSIEFAKWNEHYFNYDIPTTNAKKNDIWIFPKNDSGEKLKLDMKFYVNCIRLQSVKPESINLANRNGHMVLMGKTRDDNELGVGFSFKILILYNHKNKKYIVSPFKMVSITDNSVNCRSFGQAASTDDINQQFNAWKYGLERHGPGLGLVNQRFLDPKFKSCPNLFNSEQSNQLLLKAKHINSMYTDDKDKKKPSARKKSIKGGKKPARRANSSVKKKKSVSKTSVRKANYKKKNI
jgi:hypothetical protein